MTHSSSPALHTDHGIALVENTELDGVHDAPLQTTVNVLLPWLGVEVWLLLGEIEGVYAAIQMGVLRLLATKMLEIVRTYSSGHSITGDHNDWAHGAILRDQTSGSATNAC